MKKGSKRLILCLFSICVLVSCAGATAHAASPRVTFSPGFQFFHLSKLDQESWQTFLDELKSGGSWRDYGYRCTRVCEPSSGGGTICRGQCAPKFKPTEYVWKLEDPQTLGWGDGRTWTLDASEWQLIQEYPALWFALKEAQSSGQPVVEIHFEYVLPGKLKLSNGTIADVFGLSFTASFVAGVDGPHYCVLLSEGGKGWLRIVGSTPDMCPSPTGSSRIIESHFARLPWADLGTP